MKTNRIVGILLLVLSSISNAGSLPTGWDSIDLGIPEGPLPPPPDDLVSKGEHSYDEGIWTITSCSYRHFVYKHLEGDWQITAHVIDCESGGAAELAVTADLGSDLPAVVYIYREFMGVQAFPIEPDNYYAGFYAPWSVIPLASLIKLDEVDCWIRLERKGDTLTGYIKSDSNQLNPSYPLWTIVGSSNLPSDMDTYVGLSVTPGNLDYPAMTAKFEGVTVETYDQSSGNDWMVSGDNMYSIPTGNVGIGTSNPTSKLEVQEGPIKATGGLIIETRTSDPWNPVTGQIWLRTDL